MPYGIAPYPVSFASTRQGMVYCISWNAIELYMKSHQSMTQMHASLFLARCLRPAPVQRDSITAIHKIGFGARFVQQSKNRFLLPSQRKKRCSSGAVLPYGMCWLPARFRVQRITAFEIRFSMIFLPFFLSQRFKLYLQQEKLLPGFIKNFLEAPVFAFPPQVLQTARLHWRI